MTDKVRAHYELEPYPARNPDDEENRLITGSPSHLLEINHYLFQGRLLSKESTKTRPLRALIAGGGTGDAAIMLAQQLADEDARRDTPPSEVFYLDLSSASRRVAEARAKARGLQNITFMTGSLLDLPAKDLAPLDYIDCCGVLHHLPDPSAGLAALKAVLAPGGGMGLMLYGELGRRGVYETQEMLRFLDTSGDMAKRIAMARRLLDSLPNSNWLKRNPFIGDHKRGDAELADLLLHPLDRAYRVPEIAELLNENELRLVSFIEPIRYRPESYIKDPRLQKTLADLSDMERATFAENLAGTIKAHVFYVTRASGETETKPDSPEIIPILKDHRGDQLAAACREKLTLRVELGGSPFSVALPPLAPAILTRIDGQKSLGDIHLELQAHNSDLDWEKFQKQFQQIFAALRDLNLLLLRRP